MRVRTSSPWSSRRLRNGVAAAVTTTAGLGLLAACVPNAPATTTTTTVFSAEPVPPVVQSFSVVGPVATSPAVVTFAWSVGDANHDVLTCHLDGNGDGVDDVTVTDCEPAGQTRNVTVTLPPGTVAPVAHLARLTVLDGTHAPVQATAAFDVAPGPTESFDVVLRGTEIMDPDIAAAFVSAEARWEQIITTGVADFGGDLSGCLPAGSPPIVGPVDDVVIDVAVHTLDGPGGTLGQAGPTCVNTANELTVHGVMEFDDADVATMLADGSFERVVLHEMAHVLGFGTLWDETRFGGVRKVVQGLGGTNPRFSGARAMAEWSLLGGSGNVPVENLGGAGTVGSHWRESVFGAELMTGWIDGGTNPLSRLSIASMADLGLHVDLDQADAYSLPGGFMSAWRSARPAAADLTVERPPVGRV